MTFCFDEPPNFTERLAWWRQLMPMWSGVPQKLGCTPQILVSCFATWDCELARVDAGDVTVEQGEAGPFGTSASGLQLHTDALDESLDYDGWDGGGFVGGGLYALPVLVVVLSPLPKVTALVAANEVTL